MLAASPSEISGLAELGALKDRARSADPAALREIGVQFEALVLRMMLSSARAAMPGEDGLGDGTSEQYLELMDQQVAMALARQGALGLGKLLSGDTTGGVLAARPLRAPAGAAESPDFGAFVEDLLPHARNAARELGVDPKLLIAQAALESGWGRATPSRPDGGSSFNLFGVKAGRTWDGATVRERTLEFVGGAPEPRWEQFRAYPGLAEAFTDYVALIRESPGFRAALESSDAEGYVAALTGGGYATDPEYGAKWLALYRGERLRDALAAAR